MTLAQAAAQNICKLQLLLYRFSMKLYSLINYMNYFSSFCFLYISNEKKKCSILPRKAHYHPLKLLFIIVIVKLL